MQRNDLRFLTVTLFLCGAACGGKLSTSKDPAPVTLVSETTGKNPFKGVSFFINPDYVDQVEATAKKFPAMATTIRKVEQYPTAVWLDEIARVPSLKHWLDEAKKQQDASGKPTLSVEIGRAHV